MQAAWYERQGEAKDVLVTGELPDPHPAPGEVRIQVAVSGLNPGDVKKRQATFGIGMPYPVVVPHSDGAGVIDEVGEGVSPSRLGERVWCFGAQSYRPFGTAAQFTAVPSEQAVALPDGVSFEQGACLGIPGLTAHRAVHVGGTVEGRSVLVQGGGGAVGSCAVGLARHAGATVIATVRSEAGTETARQAGAHHTVRTDGASLEQIVERVRAAAPEDIDHVVEVAFAENIEADTELLALGGSIGTYATGKSPASIPFWPLVFKNIRVFFLGSDDFGLDAKVTAARALGAALEKEWPGYTIGARFDLSDIARAHEAVEQRSVTGRVVVHV